MRNETVTYELVRAEINKLHFAGEKISVRNVLNKTGGSFAKISEYIKRWKGERLLLRDDSISDNLTIAIKKEIDSAIRGEVAAKNQEIDTLNALLDESKSIITEFETKLSDYNEIKQNLLLAQEQVNKLKMDSQKILDDYIKLASECKLLEQKLDESTGVASKLEQEVTIIKSERDVAQEAQLIYKTKADQLQGQLDGLYEKFKIS
jgi:chromosome segregation ATPase